MTTEEIVWEEIDRVRKVNTALAEMLSQKELDAAYWKQRCEAAERVLIKYSHRIPDSPEFMDWQSTTDKTPAQPVENKSAVWVKASEVDPPKNEYFLGKYEWRGDWVKGRFWFDGNKIKGPMNDIIGKEGLFWLDENSGASQLPDEPTIDSVRVQAAKDRHNLEVMTKDRDYWKGIAEKCIAEHPRIIEGL